MNIYIHKNDAQNGPFTKQQVLELIKSQAFSTTDLAWQGDPEGWIPIADMLPELKNESVNLHYTLKGKRIGPISDSDLKSLVAAGTVDNETMVWKEGFNDWVPLGHTTLKIVHSGPPPLSGASIGNGLVWFVAFAPVVGVFLQYFFGEIFEMDPAALWFITLILNIGFCYIDEGRLKNAGHDVTNFGGWAILVPVYLFKRAKALKQPLAYFIVWMAMFFISLFL